MKKTALISALLFLFFTTNFAQFRPEIGVELNAAAFSTMGGSFGGALRGGLAEYKYTEAVAYGLILRYQRIWNKNNFTGLSNAGDIFGLGGYWHYRFMEWLFIGSELEYVRSPFIGVNSATINQSKWKLAGFLCAGASKDFDWVRLNLGLQYDFIDAIRAENKPSPFRNEYFIRLRNPAQPNAGGKYLPIIYRLTFFFPIGG